MKVEKERTRETERELLPCTYKTTGTHKHTVEDYAIVHLNGEYVNNFIPCLQIRFTSTLR